MYKLSNDEPAGPVAYAWDICTEERALGSSTRPVAYIRQLPKLKQTVDLNHDAAL